MPPPFSEEEQADLGSNPDGGFYWLCDCRPLILPLWTPELILKREANGAHEARMLGGLAKVIAKKCLASASLEEEFNKH